MSHSKHFCFITSTALVFPHNPLYPEQDSCNDNKQDLNIITVHAAKNAGSLGFVNEDWPDLCFASVILLKPKMEKQCFECLSSFCSASREHTAYIKPAFVFACAALAVSL